MEPGIAIEETGILIRDGGGFCLRRDLGGRYRLDLPRMPVDEVEKRVRVVGHLVGQDQVIVDGISLATE